MKDSELLGRLRQADHVQAAEELALRQQGRTLEPASLETLCGAMVNYYQGSPDKQCVWLGESCRSGSGLLRETLEAALGNPDTPGDSVALYSQVLMEYLDTAPEPSQVLWLGQMIPVVLPRLTPGETLMLGGHGLTLAARMTAPDNLSLLSVLLENFTQGSVRERGTDLLYQAIGSIPAVCDFTGREEMSYLLEWLLTPPFTDERQIPSGLIFARQLLPVLPEKVLPLLDILSGVEMVARSDKLRDEVQVLHDDCQVACEHINTQGDAVTRLEHEVREAIESGNYGRQRHLLHQRLAVWREKGGLRAIELYTVMLDQDDLENFRDAIRGARQAITEGKLLQCSPETLAEWEGILVNPLEQEDELELIKLSLEIACLLQTKPLPISEVNQMLNKLRGLKETGIIGQYLQAEVGLLFTCSMDKLLERVHSKPETLEKSEDRAQRLLTYWKRFGLTDQVKDNYLRQFEAAKKPPESLEEPGEDEPEDVESEGSGGLNAGSHSSLPSSLPYVSANPSRVGSTEDILEDDGVHPLLDDPPDQPNISSQEYFDSQDSLSGFYGSHVGVTPRRESLKEGDSQLLLSEPVYRKDQLTFDYNAMVWYFSDDHLNYGQAMGSLRGVLDDLQGDYSRLTEEKLDGLQTMVEQLMHYFDPDGKGDTPDIKLLRDTQTQIQTWHRLLAFEQELIQNFSLIVTALRKKEILDGQLALCQQMDTFRTSIPADARSPALEQRLDRLQADMNTKIDSLGRGRTHLLSCQKLAAGQYDHNLLMKMQKVSAVMGSGYFYECQEHFAPYASALLERLPLCTLKGGVTFLNMRENRIYLILIVMRGAVIKENIKESWHYLELLKQEVAVLTTFSSRYNGLIFSLCLEMKQKVESLTPAGDFAELIVQLEQAKSTIMQKIGY